MPTKRPEAADLEPIEKASRDEISALQLERLKWSVRHSYDNVEPYRKRCQEKGVHPDDLKQLADLAKFPFMTKTDLRDNYPFGLFAVPRNKVARLHASSAPSAAPSSRNATRPDPRAATSLPPEANRAPSPEKSPTARPASRRAGGEERD